MKTFCVRNIIIGLYRTAHECGHFQVPMPKLQKDKHAQDQQLLQSVPPPKYEYLEEAQPRQTLVIEDDSSLLAPSSINEPECKETFIPMERPESTAETASAGDTLISQVMPLLGTTPRENTSAQKYPRRYIRHIGHQSFPKVCKHSIADIRWDHHKPTKTFLTTHQGSQENCRRN